jgi:hypothetical protein
MLAQSRYHSARRATQPPPDYARYAQINLMDVVARKSTPYQGKLTLSVRDVLYMNREGFPHLFEYVKFDELGVAEVLTWLEYRFGRQLWHDRNSQADNDHARWWLITDFLIAFRHEADAVEFKLRWV